MNPENEAIAQEPFGAEPAAAAGTPPRLADRGWYLAIEFQQSSSGKFERALRLAGKHPGFCALLDEGGTCVYRVLADPDTVPALLKLVELIRNWKDARFYLRGREVTVETIDPWLLCYDQHRHQLSPACRQGGSLRAAAPTRIGCLYAGISLAPSDWDAWYSHGAFDASGAYHIDKGKLLARIDSWERLYGGCPYADPALLRRVVSHLPEVIIPREDGRWRLERAHWGEGLRLAPRSLAMYTTFLREYLGPVLDR